jgi:hypothetical protein
VLSSGGKVQFNVERPAERAAWVQVFETLRLQFVDILEELGGISEEVLCFFPVPMEC